jgi:DNA-binding transcriptional regulator GbsR (MarR family)
MTKQDRIKLQKELVEAMGRIYEKQGFGLITGRIHGFLMIMDKEQYTFDEIVKELQISKSSASNALRLLEARSLIEYTTVAGDRKRYFQLRKQDQFSIIDDHIHRLTTSRDFFKSVLELKADKNAGNAVFLKNMLDMISFCLDKFAEFKTEFLRKE